MATINEIIQSAVDRVKLKGSETWIKWSFWTRAKDVELNSGKNVETAVSELDENISNEIDRATDRENEIETALNSEITRAKSAESTLSTSINNEITRAKNAESTLETNKVPITRTINGKALSSDITLSASDVGADASGSANTALTNAKAYTDTKVADLVGTAPETLDTLEELADALKDNADIVDVLNESIATKANASDLTSHTGNTTVHITSTERTNWNDANSKKHTHSNKTVLDNTTASYTTADKTKLDGIATSAEVNQNAFSNVVVGSTTIAADSKTDSLTLAGSNVTLTPDATNDKVTIGITKANVTSALGYTPPTTNTTYGVATSSTLGLVKSGTDITVDSSGNVSVNDDSHNHVISNVDGLQTTLDGKAVKKELISENLNNVTTPGFYNAGGGNTVTNKPSGMDHFGLYVVKRASGDYYTQILIDSNKKQYRRHCDNGTWGSWVEDKLTDTNTTYSAATTSASGLMTAAMVTKLNGIATGANAYSHPTSSGNKHIPSGGSSGQILRWSADGTAVWGSDNNTTYSVVSTTADGLAPKRDGSTTKYLRADGTWAVPPDTNTTYTSLKNPYSLTIQGNGTTLTNGTYDGSAAKTVNITPSSIGAAASSHTHNYLPLAGGDMDGVLKTQNLIPNNPYRLVGNNSNPYYYGYFKNMCSNIFNITDSSNNSLASISYSQAIDVMYYSGNDVSNPKNDVMGLSISSGMYRNMRLYGQNIRLQSENYISSNVKIAMASDEKVKSFTTDIDTDEEKLVKLFDIIKPKSYSYKYVKSDNSLNIGFSAQEIEQAMIDLDIDPEKYGILNIQYGHMLSRGNDFEDGKYYTKFYEISYNDLFNLSILKTHMMEKEHVERLVALEEKASKLDELEARLSALENK